MKQILSILQKPEPIPTSKKSKKRDIIVKKLRWEEEQIQGGFLRKPIYESINLTKKIQETRKLVKANTASKKLEELEKIFKEK